MNTLFTEKTASAVFLKMGIVDALESTKSFNAANKKSAETFYASVISRITGSTCPYNIYKTPAQIREGFKKYGIETATDLVNVLLEDKKELKNLPGMSGVVKVKSLNKKEAKSAWKSKKSCKGLDPERTVVVRSQFGDYPVLFYENFVGTMDSRNNKQLTEIKLAYHYETKCKYYQVRPILLSTWLTLDPERQVCTCCIEKKDPEDLTTF